MRGLMFFLPGLFQLWPCVYQAKVTLIKCNKLVARPCSEQAALQGCWIVMFGMMLEWAKQSPQGFMPGREGSWMAQGAWIGSKPIGTCAGEQDGASSWAGRIFTLRFQNFFFCNYFWQLNETGVISQNVLLGWTCFPLTWLWLSPPRGGADVVTALCEQLRYLVTLSALRRSHSSFSPPEVSLQEQFSCGGSWHQASLSWKLGGGNNVSFNLLLPCPHVPAGGCASSQVRMPHPKALLPSPCAIT